MPHEDKNIIAVIGAGPAGLMAAEKLARAGKKVVIYERMPSPARKFLLAGRGGLNLTHSEGTTQFLSRYGAAKDKVAPFIKKFTPDDLRHWAAALGEETFIGSSGRVFPKSFKATPLLRAWLRQLDQLGVSIAYRHHWMGWDAAGNLLLAPTEGKVIRLAPAATVIAVGGASWPRLGADGQWAAIFQRENIAVTPLGPANCGFTVAWSDYFKERFSGAPLKSSAFSIAEHRVRAEAMITKTGIEGGAIYALSMPLRDALTAGKAILTIDLKPDLTERDITTRLIEPHGKNSLSNVLRKRLNLSPLALALLREGHDGPLPTQADRLAHQIKAIRLHLTGAQGLERAISTTGGIDWSEINDHLMLTKRPGVFLAGEMLDWEAPTGGYLLQACFATGAAAAAGVLEYLK